MNIKEAKIHIKNTVSAYFEKDETDEYIIPVEKQRPIFLYGPPGIGKTAVMEQIAEEMGIGLVSYSMTHHTRQSAIGLPFITKKLFGDKEYDVSEYTMSEILASVYSYIEKTDKKEGILFLDEINCVSETLSPSMLRFLQYKTFGSHAVPDGWVVITAGNPAEYNRSVREYDIATLDRIKKIDVEADYNVWREYAINQNVHPSIIAYLDIKKSDFYNIENTPAGKSFVTARGWEDLSRMIRVLESKNIDIDLSLIEQYIQFENIAEDFCDYYNTYKALTNLISVSDVLSGKYTEEQILLIRNSTISETLGFINILSNEIANSSKNVVDNTKAVKTTAKILKEGDIVSKEKKEAVAVIEDILIELKSNDTKKDIYSKESRAQKKEALEIKEKLLKLKGILEGSDPDTRTCVTDFLKNETDELKEMVKLVQERFSGACEFLQKAFGKSPELQIFISNINVNVHTSVFLTSFGCKKFSEISEVDFDEESLIDEIESLL